MKKILSYTFIALMLLVLANCKLEKTIDTITYQKVQGEEHLIVEKKIDFINNYYAKREYLEAKESIPDYQIIFTFSNDQKIALMNTLIQHDILGKERTIITYGSSEAKTDYFYWDVKLINKSIIHYSRLDIRNIYGLPNYKIEKLNILDKDFYELIEEPFLECIEPSYIQPPRLPFSLFFSFSEESEHDSGYLTNHSGLIYTNYIYRKSFQNSIDNIAFAIEHGSFRYSLTIINLFEFNLLYEEVERPILNIDVVSYDLDGNNFKQIYTNIGPSIDIRTETNRVTIFQVTFDIGYAEYPIYLYSSK